MLDDLLNKLERLGREQQAGKQARPEELLRVVEEIKRYWAGYQQQSRQLRQRAENLIAQLNGKPLPATAPPVAPAPHASGAVPVNKPASTRAAALWRQKLGGFCRRNAAALLLIAVVALVWAIGPTHLELKDWISKEKASVTKGQPKFELVAISHRLPACTWLLASLLLAGAGCGGVPTNGCLRRLLSGLHWAIPSLTLLVVIHMSGLGWEKYAWMPWSLITGIWLFFAAWDEDDFEADDVGFVVGVGVVVVGVGVVGVGVVGFGVVGFGVVVVVGVVVGVLDLENRITASTRTAISRWGAPLAQAAMLLLLWF